MKVLAGLLIFFGGVGYAIRSINKLIIDFDKSMEPFDYDDEWEWKHD